MDSRREQLREPFLAFAGLFSDPMLLVREDGLVLAANPAAERALDAEGRTLAEIAADPPAEIEDYLRNCARSRQMLAGSLTLRTAKAPVRYRAHGALMAPRSEGHEAAVVLRLVPSLRPSRFARIVNRAETLTREIARRTAAEQALAHADRERERLHAQEHDARLSAERALAEAEAANRAKDEFLSTLSHELRTPLTAILGWANILRTRSPPAPVVERALATIERNAQTQARLVGDVLDVSRIVAGKLHLDLAAVDFSAVTRVAIDALRPAAEAKGVALVADLGAAPIHLPGDADRLQQIVWNLISNAVKFTPTKGRVEVTLALRDGEVVLRVSDTGQGISPDFLPHVFERFRQADGSYRRSHGGLGIGLALAKHLTELHGGTIGFTSGGPGHGTTFVVRLPLHTAATPHEKSPTKNGAHLVAETAPLRGKRVLVVDDEHDALDLIATILRDHGAEVVTAISAADALESLGKTRVDVIVSDIGMPGEDGYALLHKARALLAKRGEEVLAIALTAYAGSEDARAAHAAGFEAHLAKPILPNALTAAVAQLGSTRN